MDEEFRIMHSPLERRPSEDGTAVQVLIYRGEADEGWILEVVDHTGGSTVSEEAFPPDQAALDEVLATIRREGIGCFAQDEPDTRH